jgi:hypothetical protein
MLTTGAGAHGVTRRWRVAGAWAVPGRMTSEGLSGLTGLFEKYRHEKNSGMGFAHFQSRRSGDK